MALGRVATAVAVVGLAPVGVIQGATRRYKDRMHFRRGPLLRRNLGERGCLLSSVTDDRLFFLLGRARVCRGEEGADDQLGAVARLRGAAGVAAAGG
jgi:hypothetical protein